MVNIFSEKITLHTYFPPTCTTLVSDILYHTQHIAFPPVVRAPSKVNQLANLEENVNKLLSVSATPNPTSEEKKKAVENAKYTKTKMKEDEFSGSR